MLLLVGANDCPIKQESVLANQGYESWVYSWDLVTPCFSENLRLVVAIRLKRATAEFILRTCTAYCCEYRNGLFSPLLKFVMFMRAHCCTILIPLPKHR